MENDKSSAPKEPSAADKDNGIIHVPGTDTTTDDLGNLCPRCASLDWNLIFASDRRPSYKIHYLLKIDPLPSDWTSPGCAFCELLKSIHPNDRFLNLTLSSYGHDDNTEAISINTVQEPTILSSTGVRLHLPGQSCLGLVSSPDLKDSCRTLRLKCIDTKRIDFARIRDWIAMCHREHISDCKLVDAEPIPSLRAINVQTRQVELVNENCRYLALSYVWGAADSTAAMLSDLGTISNVPATIEDAIIVTSQLGFEYLWVDRYCIPQNKSEKHIQIQRMDQVYKNAEMTIIAGAGNDPTYGLPGVGLKPRVSQPQARVGKYVLTSTMRPPSNFSWSSTWSSRAWTYQEGICSRRCLIFTDEQVFFQCRKMQCRETLDLILPVKDNNLFAMGMDKSFPGIVWTHISNYSGRSLTYESDALNGVSGILRSFQEYHYPVYHFWGIPILPLKYEDSRGKVQMMHRSLEESFLANLQWGAWRPRRRRKGFPSWSWVSSGCRAYAPASAGYHDQTKDIAMRILTSRVSFCLNDGSSKDFQDAYDAYISQNNLQDLSPILMIESWTVHIRGKVFSNLQQETISDEPEIWSWTIASGSQNSVGDTRVACPLHLNCEIDEGLRILEEADSHELLGLVLDDTQQAGSLLSVILVRIQGDMAERIGLVNLVAKGVEDEYGLPDNIQRISISTGKTILQNETPHKQYIFQDWLGGNETWRRLRLG